MVGGNGAWSRDQGHVPQTTNYDLSKRKWCPGSRLIYLSTDAVFDGESGPYKESDIPSPVWPYGVAKRAVYFEGASNISADYSRYGSATSVTADDVW